MNTLLTVQTEFPEALQRVFHEVVVIGHSEKEAAAALGVSRHTVHTHIKRIYRLLNVTSHRQLLSKVLREVVATEAVYREIDIAAPCKANLKLVTKNGISRFDMSDRA